MNQTVPRGSQAISRGHQLNSIESLRGVAALMVIGYHSVALMKTPAPDHLAVLETHFGLGVPLFYCLSGFVLAYGFADRLDTGGAVKAFYIRRLARIAPLFYLASVLWLVIDKMVFAKDIPLTMLLMNFSFLFGLAPGFHESIAWAGWSVGVEMLFYGIFPSLILLIGNVRIGVAAFLMSLVLSYADHSAFANAGLAGFSDMNLGNQAPFFIAGMLTFRIWQRCAFIESNLWGAALILAALALALLDVKTALLHALFARAYFLHLNQNFWAFIFALAILACCLTKFRILEHGPLRQFGKLSFSAYLLHPMIMLALVKAQLVEHLQAITDSRILVLVGVLVPTISLIWLFSTLTYKWIELPGVALGRRLSSGAKVEKLPARSSDQTQPKPVESAV